MLVCNNTQRYEWHPVWPMRGWTFSWCVGPANDRQTGAIFRPGPKFTRRQMRQMKRDARNAYKLRRREMEKLEEANASRFKHDGFPYELLRFHPRQPTERVKVPESSVPAMIAAGYRRVSNSYCHLARLDRPDWREYMAYQQAPWDPAGEGMDWVRRRGMADHYRRCYSPSVIALADEAIYRMFPASGWSEDEYVEAKIVKGIAYVW